MGESSAPSAPPTAPPAYSPTQGYRDQLKFAPLLAAGQLQTDQQIAPQEAQLLAQTYAEAAPQIANTNMSILGKIDPESINARKLYGADVTRDLGQETQLGPDLENQIQNQIRGAETARGNIQGNAPVSAEGAFKGQAALNLYQQRLGNVDAFLRAPTPEDHFGSLLGAGAAPVAQLASSQIEPTSSLYSPELGLQLGQNDYSSNLNQWSSMYNPGAGAGGSNPWMGALSGAGAGAGTGAAIGTAIYPGIGTLIGAGVGAAAGGAASYASSK